MNFKLKSCLLLLFLNLCFHQAVSLNQTQDAEIEDESVDVDQISNQTCASANDGGHSANGDLEFENELLGNVRDNFQSGIVEMLKMNYFLNKTLAAQKDEIAALKEEIKLLRKLNKLKTTLSWQDYDEFIQTDIARINVGDSFNGSTLSAIESQVSHNSYRGGFTSFVFVNRLDEPIENLTMHDVKTTIQSPAPNSIPLHTKEVFIFAPSSAYKNSVRTAFSYLIPGADVRVAAISHSGGWSAGLAFVSKDADMKSYYDTQKGIEGSYAWDRVDFNYHKGEDKSLIVGYKNLQARMFANYHGDFKTSVHIELIRVPLDD